MTRISAAAEKLSSLQQAIEESRVGKVFISLLVVVILFAGVVSNLPDSPIKSALAAAIRPVTEIAGLSQTWSLYAPNPNTRLETISVTVTMTNGTERVWSVKPGPRTARWASTHWDKLTRNAIIDLQVRTALCRWVAQQLSTPTERAARVVMVLRVQNLPPPGDRGGGATAEKVLYSEDLTGQ